MAKEANVKLASGLVSGLMGIGRDVTRTAGNYAIPMLAAGPPIVGGILGGMAGKMTDIDDVDVEEAKNQEVLEELRRQTSRLRHQQTANRFAKR